MRELRTGDMIGKWGNVSPSKVFAYVVASSLIACVIIPTSALGQDDGLSHENNVLYLHYDEDQPAGSKYWMDTQRVNVTSSYGLTVGLAGSFTFDFQLRPPLAHTLPIDGSVTHNLRVTLHIEAEGINPFPLKNLWIEWTYGERVIHSDAPDNVDPGIINFDLSMGVNGIPSGSDVELKVHFEIRAQTTFTFYTDTSSQVELSLLADNDLDGDPDATDPDDDNDGYTDVEELAAGTDPMDPEDLPTPDSDGNNGDRGDGGDAYVFYLLAVVGMIIVVSIVILKRRRS
jgi:hypothetical protein